jgi:hypothetical protein
VEYEDVLHCLFAEIVVNPVEAGFSRSTSYQIVGFPQRTRDELKHYLPDLAC